MMLEDAVEVADAQRAEDKDRDLHARLPQDDAFLDIGAREHLGPCALERKSDAGRPVPVRVCLDDGNDARREAGCALCCERRRDRAQVRFDSAEIDNRACGADHYLPEDFVPRTPLHRRSRGPRPRSAPVARSRGSLASITPEDFVPRTPVHPRSRGSLASITSAGGFRTW